jgi:hypothetical protein
MSARMFAALIRRNKQDHRKKTEEVRKISRALKKEYTQIIAISMKNINKALFKLNRRNPVSNSEKIRKKFSKELKKLERCFDNDEGTAIPSYQPGRNHAIPLEKDEQRKEKDVLWGLLYGISRKKLLVLRKALTDLLDKSWIRASNLIAKAPVLFVKKPEERFRFCVNYRALNAIISQNRYPLPLIREILKRLAKAQYYTKMNVRAAFHKFRIKKGNKWKTAFCGTYWRLLLSDKSSHLRCWRLRSADQLPTGLVLSGAPGPHLQMQTASRLKLKKATQQ